jgi:hypothetical protein
MANVLLVGWAAGVALLYIALTLWPIVAAWREPE